jgi:hypothetical protein
MNEMSAAIDRLRHAVRRLPGVLAGFSEAQSEQRPSRERWTKKEVVGHLIDSASNNHPRFVRGPIAPAHDFGTTGRHKSGWPGQHPGCSARGQLQAATAWRVTFFFEFLGKDPCNASPGYLDLVG